LKTPENGATAMLVCGREETFNRYLIRLLLRIQRISKSDKIPVQGKKKKKPRRERKPI